MRIVLQHIKNSLYLHSSGGWTHDLHEAFDFRDSKRAIKYAREHKLTGVQVLVAFIENRWVETIALRIDPPEPVMAFNNGVPATVSGVKTP